MKTIAKDDQDLNKEQKEAVEHKSGPLLIVAGAGTGKTTVITERIKWLIGASLAKPEEILALTFTEKAAREMEERVDIALPYGTFGLWISTFHSFCDRILRQEALPIGLSPAFKLMTDAQTYLFVKKNFWKFDLSYFRPSGNPYKFIEGLIQHFDRLKDEDVSVADYQKASSNYEGEEKEKNAELAGAFKTYESLKAQEGVMDFSDLISNTLKLFRTRQSIFALYQKQFKYILVDEFQDTNFAQNELLKLLAGKTTNLTVVADDDQSIYRFRGAAVSNVVQFKTTYPQARVITLVKNYRSAQEILDRAYELIKHNNPDRLEVKEKIDKRLVASGKNIKFAPEKIELLYYDRVEDEAEGVVKKIKELVKSDKREFKDFAILVRANNQSEPFVRAFERARIPFQFLGPGMLFRQGEVKDLIAYLKVLYDFTDSASLYRVLSMEVWEIPQRDLIFILNVAKKTNTSLFEMLEKNPETPAISDQTREKLSSFVDMVHRHLKLIPKETGGQLLYYFLQDSGILKTIAEFKTPAEETRVLNITKFFDRLKSFEAENQDASLFALVDYLDLAMSMGESPLAAQTDWSDNNAVNILTVHSAKGLEFPVVFLINLVEGRFPSRDRREQIPIPDDLIKEVLPEGDYHIEEERRLFYVGMTRAKERLIFSAANFYGEGKRERKLSPFVYESLGEKNFVSIRNLKEGEKQLPLFEWSKSEVEDSGGQKLVTRIDFLSYSAIETFRTCPLHYKLKNILRIPVPSSAAQSMGNSIHLALRDFYLDIASLSEKREKQKDHLWQLLSKNWSNEGFTSKRHEQESLEKAKRFLENYLESSLHANAKPVLLEKSFNFRIDQTLKILGKFDRVDNHGDGVVEIVDYKTGANVPTSKEIDADLQMTIYALAINDNGIKEAVESLINNPVKEIQLSFYYFDNGKKITTARTTAQLEAAQSELLKIRSEIENSDFACSRSAICQNCEFKMLCNG